MPSPKSRPAARSDVLAVKKDLGARIDAVRDELGETKKNVSGLKKDVAGLKTDVAELKTDAAELKTDVAVIKKDAFSLKVNVVGLKHEMSGVKAEMGEIKQGLDRIFTTLDAFVGRANDNERSYLVQGDMLKNQRQKIDNHETRISNLEAKA